MTNDYNFKDFIKENKDKIYKLAEANAVRNKDDMVVIRKDDEWREEFIYKGFLKLGSNGEDDEILFLDNSCTPFVEDIFYDIANKFATVRYFISDKKVLLEEAQKLFIEKLYGKISVEYEIHYSETTGYLWTTEELEVGGHDLLEELKSYIGKYLILIVDINEIQ